MLSAAQKTTRKKGIGSSEIAAVAGLSPWSGPLEVWARKIKEPDGPPPNVDEESHHLERGIHLEPALIDWYRARTGRAVRQPGTLVHPEHPIVIATPDGTSWSPEDPAERVLEIKSPGWRSYHHWGEPGTDQIPEHYIPQVIWECAVTGLDTADVAALLDGDLAIFHVPYNKELFDALRHRAEAFWRDYVVPRKEPPADASENARQWLARRYPRASHDLLDATAEAQEIADRLRTAKARKKEATEDESLAKNQLQQIIGSHEGLIGPDWRISWRNNKDKEVTDWEGLAKEMIAHYNLSEAVTIDRFRITKPGARVFRTTFR